MHCCFCNAVSSFDASSSLKPGPSSWLPSHTLNPLSSLLLSLHRSPRFFFKCLVNGIFLVEVPLKAWPWVLTTVLQSKVREWGPSHLSLQKRKAGTGCDCHPSKQPAKHISWNSEPSTGWLTFGASSVRSIWDVRCAHPSPYIARQPLTPF